MLLERTIPIISPSHKAFPIEVPKQLLSADGQLKDLRGRQLHDLRISVTDRCNFRCTYCMPKEVFGKNYSYLPQASVLSFEEIVRLSRLFVAHGVEKLRLTGGEPLLRKDLERLIAMLSELKTFAGKSLDLTLTTNGTLLAKKAQSLKNAGLARLTISLDALEDAVFKKINDVDHSVQEVLQGISTAQTAGFKDIKVNMVVQRGINDQEILPMARYFKARGIIVRFIEFMDVGNSNGWKMDSVVPSREVLQRINSEMPLLNLQPNYPGEVAQRWAYADGQGEIGVISSVTQAFCNSCSRARLSTEGQLYLCLFAHTGFDLRALLRKGASDAQLQTVIAQLWSQRRDNYSESRSTIKGANHRKIEMSYIGG
ncbi:MAG: GTP 3',8-cyclase MoaA [Burkholderiaceae bacterium]|nr:GTP 3',8-cyclase MoaA [Burkholderiaceae bacterium]